MPSANIDSLNDHCRTELVIYFLTEGYAVFTVCSRIVYKVDYKQQA